MAMETKCARPECVSRREELSLVKRDLQDLTDENEVLHDQLADLSREYEAQKMDLEQFTIENKDLKSHVEQYASEIEHLKQLSSNIQDESTIQTPTRAEQEIQSLKSKNEELQAQLATSHTPQEPTRTPEKSPLRKRSTEKQGREHLDHEAKLNELYTLLKDNERLRSDLTQLQDQFAFIKQDSEEKDSVILSLRSYQEDYAIAMEEQTLEIHQLRVKIEQCEHQKEQIESQMRDMSEQERDVDRVVQSTRQNYEKEKHYLESTIQSLQEQLDQSTRALPSNQFKTYQRQLETWQHKHASQQTYILQLETKVQQQELDLETLIEYMEQDTSTDMHLETSEKQHLQDIKSQYRQERMSYQTQIKEFQSTIHDLENQKTQIEMKLTKAQDWNVRYEKGNGLEALAAAHAKVEKELVEQQGANAQLREELNGFIDAVQKLQTSFSRLKTEVGKSEDFSYSDLELEQHVKDVLEVKDTVLNQLEEELQQIEREKERLEGELRHKTRLASDNLQQVYGLDTSLWSQVETFIKQLSKGDEKTTRDVGIMVSSSKQVKSIGTETAFEDMNDVADESDDTNEDDMGDNSVPITCNTTVITPQKETVDVCLNTDDMTKVSPSPKFDLKSITSAVQKAVEDKLSTWTLMPTHDATSTALVSTSTCQTHTPLSAKFRLALEELEELSAIDHVLQSQQTQIATTHSQSTTTSSTTSHDKKNLEHQLDDLQTYCRRLESSLHVIQSSSYDRMKKEIFHLTKSLAEFEVDSAKQKRWIQQLQVDVRTRTDERLKLETYFQNMIQTLEHRILYLDGYKQTSEALLKRMEAELRQSVSMKELEKAERQVISLKSHTADVTKQLAQAKIKYLDLRHLPAKLDKLQYEHDLLLVKASSTSSSYAPDPNEELRRQNQALVQQLQRQEDEFFKEEMPSIEPSTSRLEEENQTLFTRVVEVEQMYESLARENVKYKELASIAAKQASSLSKKQQQWHQLESTMETDRRELMASSEDQALVGKLQTQLRTVTSEFQRYIRQYDTLASMNNQHLMKIQYLEMQMEAERKEMEEEKSKSKHTIEVLRNQAYEAQVSDVDRREETWAKFNIRLTAFEKLSEEMKSTIDRLERQLENTKKPCNHDDEEIQSLHEHLKQAQEKEKELLEHINTQTQQLQDIATLEKQLADMQTLHTNVHKNLSQVTDEKKELETQVSDLVDKNTKLHNQVDTLIRMIHPGANSDEGTWLYYLNLYEHDHQELQQAAQVTIANLKQMIDGKNKTIESLQEQVEKIRQEARSDQMHSHAELEKTNKKLFDDNQKMIQELQEASRSIQHLKAGDGSMKALQQLQEKLDHSNEEWKITQVKWNETKEILASVRRQYKALENEKDVAEARAGEALEEIVLMKEEYHIQVRKIEQFEKQAAIRKKQIKDKDSKIQLLREALIKLKEEFLKAEDRHAIELSHAQHQVPPKPVLEDNQDEYKEEKEKLQAQVQMLREKLRLMKKQLQQLRNKSEEKNDSNVVSDLENEIKRLKRLLGDRKTEECRRIEELEKQVKLYHAQNAALREAAKAKGKTKETKDGKTREQWEVEKRLQRKIETLGLSLQRKQTEIKAQQEEIAIFKTKLTQLEEKDKIVDSKSPAKMNTPANCCEKDFIRQIKMLHETLLLKRKEWEKAFKDQMNRYETQLDRLRTRLIQCAKPHQDDSLVQEEHQFIVIKELEDEVVVLGEELQRREEEAVAIETKVMELQLENESSQLQVHRLRHKLEATSTPTASSIQKQQKTKEKEEMERVISDMKTIIDKLRSENTRLKTHTVSPGKVMAVKKRLKQVREEKEHLETTFKQLEKKLETYRQENTKLERFIHQSKQSGATTTAKSKQMKDKLDDYVHQLEDKEEQISQLHQVIAELEHRLQDDENEDTEGYIRQLEDENKQLSHELAAFDEEFFEEIEDLKYKYAQTIELNHRLQAQVQDTNRNE